MGLTRKKQTKRFANAANTIALVAPQYVTEALMKFHDEVKFTNPNRSSEGHDRALKELLSAVRKSLDLPFKDVSKTFDFHLIGSSPRRNG